MQKKKLAIDELQVESFEVSASSRGRGTVQGYVLTEFDYTCQNGPSNCLNCYETDGCTADPHDFYCHNSENYCDPTVQFTSCAENC